jgi:hypothetical protein
VFKISNSLLTALLLMISATSYSSDNSVIETTPGKLRGIEYLATPACSGVDFKQVCGPNVIKNPQTIAEWVGVTNVAAFIKRNKLDPKKTNSQTIITKGVLFTLKRK